MRGVLKKNGVPRIFLFTLYNLVFNDLGSIVEFYSIH